MADQTEQPFWVRLDQLSRLEDGWLDGQGKAPIREALYAAARLVDALPAAVGPVRIYPTAPGGVQLEWEDVHGEHAIEILPDLHLYLFTHEPKERP